MRNGIQGIGVTFVALALAVIWPLAAAAQDASGRAPATARSRARVSVSAQLSRVLGRLDALENENRVLRSELATLKGKVETSTQEVPSLQQAQKVVQQELPKIDQRVAKIETRESELRQKQGEPMVGVNFYTGWAESPFKLPGGFFYAASIDHKLWTREDGVPGGMITGEFLVGLTQGNRTGPITLDTALLGKQPVRAFVNTIEIEPTAKYHLDLEHASYLDNPNLGWLKSLAPYALAGPAIFVTIAETPGLTAGQVPLPPQFKNRRFQNVTEADIHAGFFVGAGFKYRLEQIKIPAIQGVLDRLSVGAEWRQNHFANGETLNQYTGAIDLGL